MRRIKRQGYIICAVLLLLYIVVTQLSIEWSSSYKHSSIHRKLHGDKLEGSNDVTTVRIRGTYDHTPDVKPGNDDEDYIFYDDDETEDTETPANIPNFVLTAVKHEFIHEDKNNNFQNDVNFEPSVDSTSSSTHMPLHQQREKIKVDADYYYDTDNQTLEQVNDLEEKRNNHEDQHSANSGFQPNNITLHGVDSFKTQTGTKRSAPLKNATALPVPQIHLNDNIETHIKLNISEHIVSDYNVPLPSSVYHDKISQHNETQNQAMSIDNSNSTTRVTLGTTSEIADEYYYTMLKQLMMKHNEMARICSLPKATTRPLCSFQTIQSYVEKCGYFPSKLNLTKDAKFLLSGFCDLPTVSNDLILDYFHEKINRLTAMGDSQAGLYSRAIRDQMGLIGIKCHTVKEEPNGKIAKKNYFFNDSRILDALLDTNRTCRTCTSYLSHCVVPATTKYPTSKNITFEYISLIMNLNALMVNAEYCQVHPEIEVCQYSTYSEVIFQYYLRDAYPDLLVVFASFAHDARKHMQDIVPKLQPLSQLISHTLPSNAHIIMIPATKYNFKRFPDTWDLPGVSFNEKIGFLNHWMRDILMEARRLNEGGPYWHGFFDVSDLGQIQEMQLASDYIHFDLIFYEHIISAMLSMLPSIDNAI